MRLLKKDLESISFYKKVVNTEDDGTEYTDFSQEENVFIGHVSTTLSGNKIKLYGEKSVDMISIVSVDGETPLKGDKVVYKGVNYEVVANLPSKSHTTLDCRVL